MPIILPPVTPVTPVSSGSFLFNPRVAEFCDEAFERCRIDPATLTLRHIDSARRSLNFMLKDWANDGVHQWAMDQQSQAVSVGMSSFTAPLGTVDIFSMFLRRDGNDIPMDAISVRDYDAINTKTQQGRPDRYVIHRYVSRPVVNIWMAGENATDVIYYWRLRQQEDAGNGSKSLNINERWFEALAAGLAAKLCEKWGNPQIEPGLIAKAGAAFQRAKDEDRERAPLRMRVRMR